MRTDGTIRCPRCLNPAVETIEDGQRSRRFLCIDESCGNIHVEPLGCDTVCECYLCSVAVAPPPVSTAGWGDDEWHGYVMGVLRNRRRGRDDYGTQRGRAWTS